MPAVCNHDVIVTAEDDMDEHVPSSVLGGIKEKLVVTDLINRHSGRIKGALNGWRLYT